MNFQIRVCSLLCGKAYYICHFCGSCYERMSMIVCFWFLQMHSRVCACVFALHTHSLSRPFSLWPLLYLHTLWKITTKYKHSRHPTRPFSTTIKRLARSVGITGTRNPLETAQEIHERTVAFLKETRIRHGLQFLAIGEKGQRSRY